MTSALIIFTRVPQKGKIKTRLDSLLKPEQLELLQIAMIKDCLEFALQSEYDRIIFSITPRNGKEEFIQKIGLQNKISNKIDILYQRGETFDIRFHQSVKDGFAIREIDKLAIIGSDCPFIKPSIHNNLLKKLNDPTNVVLGWSQDGGIYIVGLSKTFGNIFNFQNKFSGGIESWLLIEEAKKHKLTIHDVPELPDIDTPEDLRHAYILCKNLENSGLEYPIHTTRLFDAIGLYVEEHNNNRNRTIKVKE